MAKTITVSAAQVRKYVNNSSVCSAWKNDIKARFDLFSADSFQVDVAFLNRALEAAPNASLKAELRRDFGAQIDAANKPSLVFAQKKVLAEETKIMTGVEICGASARNSKVPEAAGRGLFLDGSCEYMVRETKKGNYLIIPVEAGSDIPKNFTKLEDLF